MAGAAKMGPRCTMGLSNTLFVMALLLSGVASLKIQAYFNETADLPCQFTNPQNISPSELVVFWQNQEKLVLYELYLGKEKPDNVDPKYMSRTSFDQDNWILRLHHVHIKDKGLYQCFIHHKRPKELVHLYQKNSYLSVIENSDTNLTCSSIHGYPEPKKMYFVLKTENSSIEHDGIMQKSQDNVTELYNVSISLSVSSLDVTSNMSIFCILQTEQMETQLISLPFYIAPKIPQPKDYNLWIGAMLLTSIIVWALVFLLIRWKRKKKKQPGVSHERETIKEEREENEQTEERVKFHVPERSAEEAQRAVKSSKTPLGEKSATHF
ncbi:PREDICTED: T-lymphocyte activation antigen CD86 isoform X2 [Galeopterus variegatus]|uniref:T-lymphocyte activation antigen CD86 isoform X2 n=1 Tax=Galeopterus variegatus TaxID=482537 RepID=A0ABM0Q3U1_GALVR|nr:PREDICTED: T-lymphocyte activation antigen CD86 isoform X2 [Galeopterus variegatus]